MKKGTIKKHLKKFIVLASVLTSLVAFSACGYSQSKDAAENTRIFSLPDNYHETIAKNTYIIIEDVDGYVLHKGNARICKHDSDDRFSKYLTTELDFNCGGEVFTNCYQIYREKEEAEKHCSKVCEKCFEK